MIADSRKTALVTGAGRRIGRAIALALGTGGWHVVVHFHRSEDDARAVTDEIIAAGGRAVPVEADLGDETEAAGLIDKAAQAAGPLDCLINNASVFGEEGFETVTPDSWRHHMQVNLHAPFQLSQAFAAVLPAGCQGNIINIIDQRVLNLTPRFPPYTVSKFGLWGLTQSLALRLAPRIRVNAVGPGPTLPSVHQTDADFERQWRAMPLARPVSTDDICSAVRFFLDAPAVTGQMIAVDSGQHLGWAPSDGGSVD